MLKFNSEHKSINGNISESKNKIKVRNIFLGTLVVSFVFLFSGCAKEVECDVDGLHAHKYVSGKHLDKYIVSEKEFVGSWDRLDDYVLIDKEQEELLSFINKKDLFVIEDNIDEIEVIEASKEDYIEYRYRYTYMQPIPHIRRVGKTTSVSYTYVPQTRYSWTNNPNHSRLTGQQRVVHHMYQGYKIVLNEKGKYKIVKSEFVESIEDLPNEYKYVKSDFCKKVYLDNKELEVDYEDGPEEENEQVMENEQTSDYENGRSKTKVR